MQALGQTTSIFFKEKYVFNTQLVLISFHLRNCNIFFPFSEESLSEEEEDDTSSESDYSTSSSSSSEDEVGAIKIHYCYFHIRVICLLITFRPK